MSFRTITIDPLTPTIGATIGGVDLTRRLDLEVVEEIHQALMEHQVVFFRDQPMTPRQQLELGRRFGDLHVHPTAPCVDGIPELMKIHTDASSKRNNGDQWHSDVSCDEKPPMGSILHLHTVPESGGDTLFASMYAAYDALSKEMKRLLDPLESRHDSEHFYRGLYDDEAEMRRDEFPSAAHPVVRTHPETGRRLLFVNSMFTTRIPGLEESESRALLDFLFRHVERPEFQCRFRWRPHSVAFWDNRCTQHYAVWDYHPQTRSGVRVTIAGDRPA